MLRREKSDWPTDPSPPFFLPAHFHDPFDDRLIDAWRSHGFRWFVCMYVIEKNKIWTTCFRTYNRLKDIY